MSQGGVAATEHAVAGLLKRAANRGEAIVGAIRLLFSVLMLGRVFAYWNVAPGAGREGGVAVAVLVGGIALFVWGLAGALRERFTPPLLVASTLVDALLCGLALGANALWPASVYIGLLRMPDVGALLMMVFISTLRLTPVAALASGAANLAVLLALVALDRAWNAPLLAYGRGEVTMVIAMLATTTAACWGLSTGARALVRRAALESVRAEQARRSLRALLQEHHDVRTLLSAAHLHVDLLARGAADEGGHVAALARLVRELETFVENVKGRALSELAVADGSQAVPLGGVLSGVAQALRARFPDVELDVSAPPPLATVNVMGGERGLTHVLSGLLLNACEGDGSHTARLVRVKAGAEDLDGAGVRVDVVDDGPGFPRDVLAARGAGWITTKRNGSGLGLALAKAVVESSGGRFELGNGEPHGARVSIWLPAR